MSKTVSVVQAKRDFSELMGRVALKQERFVIERKGKPMAALISVDDLEKIEMLPPEDKRKKGLLAVIGGWEDYPKLDQFVIHLYATRRKTKDRVVQGLQ